MKRIVSVTAVFLCGISLLQAQPVRVSETLKELDMENICLLFIFLSIFASHLIPLPKK